MKSSFFLVPCIVATVLLPFTGCIRIPVGRRQTPKPQVTAAEFAQISLGMTYLQVEAIVGEPGHHNGGDPLSYSWYNPNDQTGAIIFFEKDKLTHKMKVGALE